AAPLLDFCREPRRTTNDQRPTATNESLLSGSSVSLEATREVEERDRLAGEQDAARNQALRALAAGYQVAERPLPGGLIGRIRQLLVDHVVRPFVAPLVDQQNAHNAAVLRALDALAENADTRRSDVFARIDTLGIQLGSAEARRALIEHQLGTIKDHLSDLDENDVLLAERIAALGASERGDTS
ncbi:MAG TPA: hypothetical protein VFO07_15200, partial [Roseiflexaceae bacterium]|nr:hypothetical protein [Roseiflexaceae bacterium]